jgi:hypothetical protein
MPKGIGERGLKASLPRRFSIDHGFTPLGVCHVLGVGGRAKCGSAERGARKDNRNAGSQIKRCFEIEGAADVA